MDDYLRKGRSLQLEGLANAPIKVTLGFKCEGQEKIALAREAHQAAMTLSEYVEYVVSLRHQQPSSPSGPSQQAASTIQQLRQDLAVYEQNELLQSELATYRGKLFTWEDSAGQKRTLTIRTVADVFTILISSFKLT